MCRSDPLARAKAILAAATPGPWRTGRSDMQSYHGWDGEAFTNLYSPLTDGVHEPTGEPLPHCPAEAKGESNKEDAAAIALSRNIASPSLALLEAVQRTIDAHGSGYDAVGSVEWDRVVEAARAATEALREGVGDEE